MIKENLTLDEVIAFLNELIATDKMAVENLISHKVQCNDEMTDHPSVQVEGTNSEYYNLVGFLGILNGMFGVLGEEAEDKEGWGAIVAVFDGSPDKRLQEFKRSTDYEINTAKKDRSETS